MFEFFLDILSLSIQMPPQIRYGSELHFFWGTQKLRALNSQVMEVWMVRKMIFRISNVMDF